MRETARRLGVHENTVRNWARDGILKSAKVPGSRFHRFDVSDVERLQRQRGASVASVGDERLTIGPELIDATQLSSWAGTMDAREAFPELMRRLITVTPGLTNVSIRAHEGIAAAGWDGSADSDGSSFLPRGSLRFEFGVGASPATKAKGDYAKRVENPLGATPGETTFVFATPRRWAGADAWAAERREAGDFADVKVIDADDFEGWLQQTPAVHQWISERLGRRPRDAETSERWWGRFSSRTEPPLPLSLFLAGRDAERRELAQLLAGERPAAVVVEATWRDDAVAFVCATVEEMTREGSQPNPLLLVSSDEVWDRVAAQPGRMTLVPLFDDPHLGLARKHEHHVVLPVGWNQVVRDEHITLPRPHRQEAAAALEAAGVDSDQAYRMSALARRSMPSLIRKLAKDPRFTRPVWGEPPAQGTLAPLVLVGSWTSKDEDLEAICQVVDQPWRTVERTLLHWRKTDDPPFVRTGSRWHLASEEEAFLVLGDSLTADDLERWHELVLDALLENDPRVDLRPDERPLAAFMGQGRRYSSALREGLARGIALLGWADAAPMSDGVTAADHARRAVRQVLERASADSTGQTWRSLASEMKALAEGAPDVFLDAVHADLDRERPLLGTMFQDSDRDSWLFGSSPHPELLWALELLCWSPEFLVEATRALARLDDIDPGGRLSNRPLESLQSVLVGWIRHTAAPLDLRKRAVEQIADQLPDVGWKLVLKLWPTLRGVSSPPASPRYRDWKPETRNMPVAEWVELIEQLVALSIELAGGDAERWGELATRLGPLPPSARENLLAAIERLPEADWLNAEDRLHLWDAVNREVSRHRRFSSAEWSMDDAPLLRMEEVAKRLEPTSNVARFAYLFDWHPDLPDAVLGDETYDERLLELRTEALSDTIDADSVDGLRALTERSAAPSQLGWTLARIAPESLTPALLTWLDSESAALKAAARSWASHKLLLQGVPWLRETLGQTEKEAGERRTALALAAPPTRELWDTLNELDGDLYDAYWKGMSPWHVLPQDIKRAIHELLRRGRAWAAIDMLASTLHHESKEPGVLTVEIVENVLEVAVRADPREATSQSLGYEVGMLLDFLEREGFPAEALATYELVYFRLLEDHRRPRALYGQLADSPAFFVELVSRVYRGKHEERRQLDEGDEAFAQHAWTILHDWRQIPGLRDDGKSIDAEHLGRWVRDARLAFSEADREDIGDEQIGQVLAGSPDGADGLWPAEPVRYLVETIGSANIETGLHLGVVNRRGITTRGVYDGGAQERELANRYREWARQASGRWPRTSRVLRTLADTYERDARDHDTEAELSSDFE
ncbi:MAG: helix-turn-helix domain-containing protein [Thermoleophilaceae bacterium]